MQWVGGGGEDEVHYQTIFKSTKFQSEVSNQAFSEYPKIYVTLCH